MENQLRPYQKIGVDFLTSHRHALLADDMGIGKTIQALVAIRNLRAKKILIICPANVKYQWVDEMKTWLGSKIGIQVINTRKDTLLSWAHVYIVNYDLIICKPLRDRLQKFEYAVGICDEAHFLKAIDSQRSHAILGKEGILRKCHYKWMLTGTPMRSRPIELYPILRTLAEEVIAPYTSYTQYAYRYCGAYQDAFGLNTRGSSHVDELNKNLKKFMLRREKQEVLPDLPERVLQMIDLPATPAVEKVIQKEEEMNEALRKKYKESEFDELGMMASIRRDVALAKIPQCVEFIKNALESKKKIVIFAHHRDVIFDLEYKLAKYDPVIVIGGYTARRKEQQKRKFIDNPIHRLYIANLQAAGTGTDGLQKVCDHVIFVESSWVPGEISQAVDRLHRWGQENPVLAQFLVSKGTIESAMLGSAIKKNKIIKQILN